MSSNRAFEYPKASALLPGVFSQTRHLSLWSKVW